MYLIKFYLLAVVLCTSKVFGEDVKSQSEQSTKSPIIEFTHLNVLAAEKPKPVPPTTITTPEPTTPETTSSKTTTTTTTTTVAPEPPTTTPVTTTSAPPAPPAPKPVPGPPQQGKWNYTDAGNVTCILVQFAAQLNVTYTSNSTNALTSMLLNVPINATVVNGSCNGTEQWLSLSWPVNGLDNTSNSLVLVFHNNATTKNYALKSLNVSLAPQVFPNSQYKDPVELWHGMEWQTPLATSYRCEAPTQLNMTVDTKNVAARLTLSQLQEEAFRTADNKAFSAARDCGGGDVPDAVPIAVGCALGGLVVVVLVAYLMARRRSAARGYLSM